jgi:hypothetical protein
MAYTETHSSGTEKTQTLDLTLPGLAALGRRNIEELARVQSDLLSTMGDAHQRWFDRMQSEAQLASDFTRKVTNCRSIPDAMAVCQEWTGRRLEMMADDSRHLLSDSRRVMERSARFLSDGVFAGGNSRAGAAAEGTSDRERVRAAAEPVSKSDVAWK